MFKNIILPTNCAICYWGRLALLFTIGTVFGAFSVWAIAIGVFFIAASIVGKIYLTARQHGLSD